MPAAKLKKSKPKKYPENVNTDVAKRLYDEGLIQPEEANRLLREERTELKKREGQIEQSRIYKDLKISFNPYPNRRTRRMQAKQFGHLRRDDEGRNDWAWRYKGSQDNTAPQTYINPARQEKKRVSAR